MANYVSPGVYVIEKDVSEYTPSINSSVVGIVGFASRGPVDKATLITSQNNLINTFGEPSEALLGQGLEGALEILEQTNSLYYIRSASDDATEASGVAKVGCGAAFLIGAGGYGVTEPLTLRIQITREDGTLVFSDNSNTGKDFTIAAGLESLASNQARAVRKVLGGDLDADNLYVEYEPSITQFSDNAYVITTLAGSGVKLEVSACSGTTFDVADGAAILRRVDVSAMAEATYGVTGTSVSSVTTYGGTIEPNDADDSARYLLNSLYVGAGYNGGVKSNGDSSGLSFSVQCLGGSKNTIQIIDNGTTVESFQTRLAGSGAFITDTINTGLENLKSEYIKGNLQTARADVAGTANLPFYSKTSEILPDTGFDLFSDGGNAAGVTDGLRFNKLVATPTTNLTGGDNGIGAATSATVLIGESTGTTKTGIQALDDNLLNISIAIVPGISTESVQNALITAAETSQNFIALVSPPYAIGGVQNAIDWTNGKASGRSNAINSSYAAVYWPWVKVFSTFDGKDRWYDPVIFAARQMAYTDAVSDVWFAPAGFQRGRLTKPSEVEVILNQGDRDSLYSGGNIINPIVGFPQQGLTIFGQRTTQRSPSALDRINIRRMMIYIRKLILASTQRFIFEPNDEFTWAKVEANLNPTLDEIRRRRGITEFRVVCDETTNTPVRVDRNEMWTKVIIRPTKTAEIIIFEINLTNQSADLGTI
jgi:phage tail sheath protein FI